MGILLLCDTAQFSCDYGHWNNIRMDVLYASLLYLENRLILYERNMVLIDRKTKLKYYSELSLKDINAIKSILRHKTGMVDVFCFNDIVNNYGHDMIDDFIRFDIGGLWSIMSKKDDTGYYSPGNSLDILILLKKLEMYIIDPDLQRDIVQIKKVFNHSVATRKNVQLL